MRFEDFCERVNALCIKTKLTAKFRHDKESGRYIAACSDGTKIIGHESSTKVTYRWGSGHCSVAPLPSVA